MLVALLVNGGGLITVPDAADALITNPFALTVLVTVVARLVVIPAVESKLKTVVKMPPDANFTTKPPDVLTAHEVITPATLSVDAGEVFPFPIPTVPDGSRCTKLFLFNTKSILLVLVLLLKRNPEFV